MYFPSFLSRPLLTSPQASFKFTKGDTVVSLEKLWFLQRRHASRYASIQPPKPPNPSHDLEKLAVKPTLTLVEHHARQDPEHFSFYGSLPEDRRFDFVRAIIWADSQNYSTPYDFISRHVYFFTAPTPSTLVATRPSLKLYGVLPELAHSTLHATLLGFFQDLSEIKEQDWNTAELKRYTTSIVDQGTAKSIEELRSQQIWSEELKPVLKKAWAKLVHGCIRWAIMAGMPGPDGAETMRILGRSESLRRLEVAEEILQSSDKEVGA
jgi:glutamyl-tRNA synthetase